MTAPFWESIRPALTDIKIRHTEKFVQHLDLGYAGTLDGWGLYKDLPTLIDFKTAKKAKRLEWIEDYCLQTVAYAGALQATTGEITNQALVLIALAGQPCQRFVLSSQDMIKYWSKWLRRVEEFYNAPDVVNALAQAQAGMDRP